MDDIEVLQHLAERVFPNKCVRTLLGRGFAQAKDVTVAVRGSTARSWFKMLTVHYKVRRLTVDGEKWGNRWFVLSHVYAPTEEHPNVKAFPDLTGFGTDGEVLLHFVLRDHAIDVERQPDGKILVVGAEAVGNGTRQITPSLYRFNSDGTLDTTFADSGKAVHRFTGNSAGELYGIKVLPDGRILTA